MNAPSQIRITSSQASNVIQRFFEGIRPQEDGFLKAALQLKGLHLAALKKLQREAGRVTRGKPAFCVLTPTGSGRNRLTHSRLNLLSPRSWSKTKLRQMIGWSHPPYS